MKTIKIATTHDSRSDYMYLFQLWNELNKDGFEVRFDFSSCSFFKHNAICFLGGLARLIISRGGSVDFGWETMNLWVSTTFEQNGFKKAFEHDSNPWDGTTIPYRELRIDSESPWPAYGVSRYLEKDWLGKGCILMSKKLQDAIRGKVLEIFGNAFEHSSSDIGIFSCGQHYKLNKKLSLCVIDFGVGIPSNVRHFEKTPDMTAHEAMQKAFSGGYTTKPNGTPRGSGLDILKRFINVNHGCLEVFSHDGYVRVDSNGEIYQLNQIPFEGTLVNVTLHCDETYYCFKSEIEENR